MIVKSEMSRTIVATILKLARETLDEFKSRSDEFGVVEALYSMGAAVTRATVTISLLEPDRSIEDVEAHALDMLMAHGVAPEFQGSRRAVGRAAREVLAICGSVGQIDGDHETMLLLCRKR